MNSSFRLVAAACAGMFVLAAAGTASADNVTATLSASAQLGKRAGENAWNVEVKWAIVCHGATEALYFGDLYLIDQGSGERIYLGGASAGSGKDTVAVAVKTHERRVKPYLKASCSSYPGLQGSGTVEVTGNEVVVPGRACDSDLLKKALREFATGKSFYDAGSQDLKNAHEEWVDSRNEYATESAKIGVEKAAGLQLIHSLGADAVLLTEVTAFWVGIGVAIEEVVLKLIPSLVETRKAFREAHGDYERAETWTVRGKADLEQALAQGPCTGPLESKLDQALDQQRRQSEARTLIDSWENNGYQYVNPANGEVLDEAAALREARNALTSGQRKNQVRAEAASRVTPITATRGQIQAAVAKLTKARALNEQARMNLQRADAAAERLRARIQVLARS